MKIRMVLIHRRDIRKKSEIAVEEVNSMDAEEKAASAETSRQ